MGQARHVIDPRMNLTLKKAFSLCVGELDQPVVTDYELARILVDLFHTQRYKDDPISVRREKFPDRKWYLAQRDYLLRTGILTQDRQFPPKRVFTILGKKGGDPGDVACSVDPFCYISHLSAMAFHGITDRNPSILFISSPTLNSWKSFAEKRMAKELGDSYRNFHNSGLPCLRKIDFKGIGPFHIRRIPGIHTGAFKSVRGRKFRVSSIGRTFLDMLRTPGACGGMRHVVDVFEEHGERYATLIIDEIDRHGNKIEKVRAGYLLEEYAGASDPRIDGWLEHVQRGGSRKLDPEEEYSPDYSERWCLSINL